MNKYLWTGAALAAAFFMSGEAWAACSNTIDIQDGNGTHRTFCRGTDGGTNWATMMQIIDGSGGILGVSATPLRTDPTGTTPQPATQSGNWTARIVGNGGAIFDFAGQNASSPANAILTGCQFNTSPTTITSGNVSPEQCDSGGRRLTTARISGNAGATLDAVVGAGAAPTNMLAVGGQYRTSPLTLTNTQTSALQLDVNGYLIISPNNVSVAIGSTTSGETGSLVMGATTTAAPTYTTAQTNPLSLTTAGDLRAVISNTSFAATQSGNWSVRLQDGSGTTISSTSNNLNVQCANCSGSGASAVDEASYTAGSSVFAPAGGFFQTTATTAPLTNGQQGMAQMTATRALFSNPRDSAGSEIADSTLHKMKVANSTAADLVATVRLNDGSGNSISSTTNQLNVNCGNCSGSGVSQTDEGAFTAGSSAFASIGGFFQTTATSNALTNGQFGSLQLTANRAAMVNLRTAAGAEIGTSGAPVRVDPTGTTTQPVSISGNQAVNVAQVNGVTTSVGTGAVGTGSQRVAVGVDTATIAGSAPGTAGTASSNVVTVQGVALMTPVQVSQATASSLKAQVAQLASISTSGTLQSAVTANGNGSTLATDGMAAAIVTVNCATCSGGTTINFEGSEDSTNYSALSATQLGTSTIATSTATAGVTVWEMSVAGTAVIRARVSGYSAGTVTVTGHTVPVNFATRVTNSNIALGGTAIDGNSGNKSAGTVRVVVATDQPNLTSALNVSAAQSGNWTSRTVGAGGATMDFIGQNATQPANSLLIGGEFNTSPTTITTGNASPLQLTAAANLKTDMSTVAGTAVDTNSGNKSAGTQRVVIATDQPNLTTALNVALAANQSVNVAQINGVTPLMGNGATGTGSHRVTIASDNTAIAGVGAGATGATVPATAAMQGGRAQNAEATAVTNGQLVAAAMDLAGKQIMLPFANPENIVNGVITSAMTGTTTTSLIAAPAASLRNYLTSITCYNTHATVSTDILIQDGSGGTTIGLVPAAAVYGGATIYLAPALRQPTTATALFVANVTTGASTKCWGHGYIGT